VGEFEPYRRESRPTSQRVVMVVLVLDLFHLMNRVGAGGEVRYRA